MGSKISLVKKILVLCIAITALAVSCQHNAYVLPTPNRTGDPAICFETDILPIFISECAKSGCHDAGRHENGYVLDSYEGIMRRGIVPGNAAASKIYQSLMGWSEEPMPKDAPMLDSAKTGLIARWINAGAIKDSNCYTPCDSNNYTYSGAIKPLFAKYCTSCHGGINPQGGVTLVTISDVRNAVLNKNLVKCINYAPGYVGMPNSGLHLSVCQIRQVEKWVAYNMPDN